MKNLSGQLAIVGEIPCCVCGAMMSQKDVANQEAIASTNEKKLPFCNVVAHLFHFYEKDKGFAQTKDYELNMTKFTLAVGRDNGYLTPEAEKRASVKIVELEGKLKADGK